MTETEGSFWVRAQYDYHSTDDSSLSFSRGDIVEVLTRLESGWWDGLIGSERGWFPSNFVVVIDEHEAEAELALRAPMDVDPATLDASDSEWVQDELEATLPSDDLWLPEVQPNGQIVYVNTAGQRRTELPDTDDMAPIQPQPTRPRANTATTQSSLGGFAFVRRTGTPEPWLKRLTDDGHTFYYENTETGEIVWTRPEAQTSTQQSLASSASGLDLRTRFRAASPESDSSEVLPANRLSVYSDASEVNPRFEPDLSPDTEPYTDPSLVQRCFHLDTDSIDQLAQVARQAIAAVAHCMQQDQPDPHAPLVAQVIVAVRNLLYISGTLAPAPAVVAPLAPSPDPIPDPPQAIVELKQFQRKVTATLSKLVLSARAADSGEDDVNARSRVVIDASELERAVDRFVHEAAERGLVDSQCEGAKHRGILDSSRVGRGAPGGGLGGRWRGNGFGERAARALSAELSEELGVLGKGLEEALAGVEDAVRAHDSESKELEAQTIVTRGRAAIAALCALLNAAEEVDVASKVGRDIESRRGMVRRAVLTGQAKRDQHTKDQLRHTSSRDQLRHTSSRDQLRHANSRDQLRHANSRDQLRHANSRDELRNTRQLGLSRPASRDKLSRMGSRDELGPHALGMSRHPSRDQLRDHIPHQPSRDQLPRQTSRDHIPNNHIPHQPSRDHLPRQSSRDQLSRPGSRGGLSRPASRDRLSRPGSSHRSPRGVGLPASPALRQDTESTLRPGLSASPKPGLPASPKPTSPKIGLSLDTSQDVRLAVRRLEFAKQALYDAGVTLLLASQTVHVVVLRSAGSVPSPDSSLDADALKLVSSSLAVIRKSSREMLDIYDALARADQADAYVPVPTPGTNTRSVRSRPVESAYMDDPLAALYGSGDAMFGEAFGFDSIGRDSRVDSMTTRDTRADSVTTWDTRVESVTTRDTRESRLDSFTRDARADSVTRDTRLDSITRDTRLDSITRDTRLDSITRDTRLDSTESARGTYSRAYPERGIYTDADRGRQDDRFYDKSRAGPHLDSAVSLPQSDVSAESNGNGGFYSRSGTALGKSRPEDDLDSSGDEFDKPAAHRPSKLEKLLGPEANEVLRSGGTVTPAPIIDATPWYLKPTYNDPSQIMTNTDGGVRGGTLPALVERLTMHDQLDATFIDSFLMTYKSFTDIKELFQLLVERFRIEPPDGLAPHELEDWKDKKQKPAQVRVVNIFRKMLLDSAVIDKEDSDILEQIKKFAAEIVNDVPPAKQLIVFVDRIQTQGDTLGRKFTTTLPASLPPSILPKPGKRIKLIDIDPLELARQLTLMESKLYNAIKPIECLARARDEPAENDSIKTIITTTNKIASWVAFSVLDKEDARRRGLVLKHFIQVAEKCRALHNYSSMAALIAGLNSPPIRRLKRSWDAVPSKFTMILDDVETTLDSNKNFTTYKQRLKSIVDPCVPFLGVYLTMLTFIQDGNKDFISKENGIINFGKRQKTAEVIREIQGYQARLYQLAPVDQIQTFIEQQLASVEEKPDYWDKSLSVEPREREDEKMTRMLQESGFL